MYEKVFEQTERLFKPVGEIWALQAQAAETLARKQTSMVADLWNQGVMTLQSIPSQKNIEDVWKLQQEYWENLNGSMREMMEDTQGILLDTNQKITEVLQKTAPEAGAAIKGTAEDIAETAMKTAKKTAPEAAAVIKDVATEIANTAMDESRKAASVAESAASAASAPTKVTPPVPVKPMAEAIKSATTRKDSGGDKKAAAAAPAKTASSSRGGKSDQATKAGANTENKAGKLL
jgi:hypothetical protein